MKHRPNTSSEQAKSMHCSTCGAVYAPLQALATDDVAKKAIKNTISIVVFALFMMGSLLLRPASAQTTYATTTPLYQPGTQLNSNIGICIHVSSAQNFAEAAADGFTWIRIGMMWDAAEKTQGKYDWTQVDQICTWCKEYHLKPEWLVIYGNTLYGNACSPAGITAFANFVQAGVAESIAQGFKGARYEIWNEPENFGWTGLLYNAPNANILTSAQVAQLNNAAVGPIHAADPTALVCTSAFGSLQTQVYWGKPAFDQGLGSNGAFDAVGLHTYNLGQFYHSTEGTSASDSRNDNPECLMAYNSSNLSADIYQQVTLSMMPSYIPGMKTYWVTENGRQLGDDCNNNQDTYAYQWVRTTLCEWMAGIQWQAHYDLDSDPQYNLQGNSAEQAMKFLLTKTNGRSIASMSFPSFSGTLPPNNAIWSVTLTGSPTVQIVWVPEGSASVPVPAGWTATDMYGNSLSSQITNNALPMQESSGVSFLTAPVTVQSLTLSPTSVKGGAATSTGTITLSGPAPAGGVAVTQKSSDTSAATLAPNLNIPAGAVSAKFKITTYAVTANRSVTITSALNGSSQTAMLTVAGTAPATTIASLSLSPTSVKGGKSSTGTITLSGPAPAGGVSITQTSSDTSAATLAPKLNVAAGQTTAKFKITTYAASSTKTVTITSTLNGTSKTASLTVTH